MCIRGRVNKTQSSLSRPFCCVYTEEVKRQRSPPPRRRRVLIAADDKRPSSEWRRLGGVFFCAAVSLSSCLLLCLLAGARVARRLFCARLAAVFHAFRRGTRIVTGSQEQPGAYKVSLLVPASRVDGVHFWPK